jgi:hypothetical protein
MRGGGTPEGGSMKFCTFVESLDVIKCANFHVYLMINLRARWGSKMSFSLWNAYGSYYIALRGRAGKWYKHIYLTLLYLTLPFFFSLPSVQTRPLNRFARTISQTTRIAPRKCLLGVSSMKKNFHGGISLPQNFQRAFYMQIEKVE